MTGGGPSPGRLTLRQVLGWGFVMAVIVALVVLYLVFGRNVRPLLGLL